jgi:CRISPR-associated exonuclease Cas4
MAHWVNPDRGEMFFAKKVVFVEGETEKTIIPYLADRLGCLDHEVSLVDCGSKFNLPLYMAIANAFCLEYLVIHDEDALPNPIPANWKEGRINDKECTNAFNSIIADSCDRKFGSVRVLSPDFESFAGVSKAQGDKKGKPIAALDYFGDLDEVPPDVEALVRIVYATATRLGASNEIPT